MTNIRELLEGAKTIVVHDWPHPDVPATLVRAGYVVAAPTHPPDSGAAPYLLHEVSDATPGPADGPTFELDDGFRLFFRPLQELPEQVDIVSTYRPPDEQPATVEEAIRLGARAIWIEPGVEGSPRAREMAVAAGVGFVEGVSIATAVKGLAPA